MILFLQRKEFEAHKNVGENLAHFWVRCLIFVTIYFLFFWVPSIAHLEPQLESFEVDDIGDDGDDDLS